MEKPKRWLVVPGEVITDQRVKLGPNVFVEGGKVYAKVVGLAEISNGVARVIPLEGRYVPRPGDSVIGIIVDIKIPGYDVDINSPYSAFLPRDQIAGDVQYGDVIVATVKHVDEVRNALLENASVLKGGEVITIRPTRVPRVIGKRGSMLNVLKDLTGVSILVGANGRIWISGANVDIVKDAIFMIEREAHTTGLTDRVTKFIKEQLEAKERGKNGEEGKE